MKWDAAFSVGIPEIDEQHTVIVDCITLLEEAVHSGVTKKSWSAVHSAVGRLADYVRIHFAVEESLMRIHAYPDFDRHAEEHRQFTFNLMRLQEKSLKVEVSKEMIDFLDQWLRDHIMESDKRYASYLPAASVGKGPAKKNGARKAKS